jgi:hypothetical protein
MFVLIPTNGNSGDIPQIKTYEDCVPLVGYIADHKGKISKDDLVQFFSSFSNDQCLNNAKYYEHGNEVLFSLIEPNPLLFFQTLFSLNQNQIEAIKFQIDNPVNYSISVILIYRTVKSSNMPKDLKTEALDFLHKSYIEERKMIENPEKIYELRMLKFPKKKNIVPH